MRAAARWCFRHRLLVVALWLLVLVGTNIAARGIGSSYQDNFSLPQAQSFQAMRLLERSAPRVAGDVDRIVVATSTGHITDPAVRARMNRLLSRIERMPHVTQVVSPYRDPAQVARSGRVAFATVTFDIGASDIPGREVAEYDLTIQYASGGGVTFAGDGQAAEDGNPSGTSLGLPIGFVAAGAVLLLVFGTLAAVMLPLLTAGFALGTGIAVVALSSHLFTIASWSGQLSMLIGLGVGVDYALFIVTRYRQGMMRGLDREEAVVQALDTSGRAVLFAGVIVCVAMLGMMLLGVSFLFGVAVAAAITVALTVIGAMTLMPALLSIFGGRVLCRSDRGAIAAQRFTQRDESPAWRRWTEIMARRPALFAVIATGLMLALTIPFLSMRLGAADASSDPSSTTTHQAYDLLARGFGAGYNGPLEVVASVDSASPRQRAAFTAVVAAIRRTPDVRSVAGPVFQSAGRPGAGAGVAEVYADGSPQSASTGALLGDLRDVVIPRATAGTGLRVLVGGQTAVFADFASVLTAKLPLFVGIVVLVSSLLLMVVFRSLVVPLAAAVMNLLSTAASLGVVTAVFQFGWFDRLLGIVPGPIEAFVPVLMFPILFGLSMDYEVFLVSRIYEEWHRHSDNREAVTHGLAATGKTITAAALIMVLVFAGFVLGGQRIIMMFGIGLASAVLLDAMIVRSVVVPSLMLLLGRANWHMPTWLERRLPHLRVEGHSVRPPAPKPAAIP